MSKSKEDCLGSFPFHEWNGPNHTTLGFTTCSTCGLKRRALVDKKDAKGKTIKGRTQYYIDGRWRFRRAPPCLVVDKPDSVKGVFEELDELVADMAVLDGWITDHPGCSYKGMDGWFILALPNGFSKRFAGGGIEGARHNAAEHIRKLMKKKAAAAE